MLQRGFKAQDSAPAQFLHPTAAKAHPWIHMFASYGLPKNLQSNAHGEHWVNMITTEFWDSGIPYAHIKLSSGK